LLIHHKERNEASMASITVEVINDTFIILK